MGIKQVAMELHIYWLNLLLNPTFSSQILVVRRIESRGADRMSRIIIKVPTTVEKLGLACNLIA